MLNRASLNIPRGCFACIRKYFDSGSPCSKKKHSVFRKRIIGQERWCECLPMFAVCVCGALVSTVSDKSMHTFFRKLRERVSGK